LDLQLPRTDAGGHLFHTLCSALQSPRTSALETLILRQADLQNGCGSQLATALRMRSCQSLTELHLDDGFSGDEDTAEVVFALKTTRKLTAHSVCRERRAHRSADALRSRRAADRQ
jgi:hypothetical protein